MIISGKMRLLALVTPLALGGCITAQETIEYSIKETGFSAVSAETTAATNKQTVWIQNQQQAEEVSDRVHGMIHKKTISADTAVQIALLNNKGLQAAYADIGMNAAEVWQQMLPENPTVSIGVLGIGTPGLAAWRAIEGILAANILSLATRDRRVDIADTRFRQAQLKAAMATLTLASETRRAWINSVSAFETVYFLNQGQSAADAASELAKKLGETGALGKGGQAREHAFYSELTGQKAEARLAAKLAKEELTRLMGIWGSEIEYFVPDQLPRLPSKLLTINAIEREALQKRVDLQVAKLELEAVAKSYGLTDATRFVTDFEIIGGFEKEREIEDEKIEKLATKQVEFEFVIPIFDSGMPRLRKAELAYMQVANLLAEKAVNIRSEARSAYTSYRSTHEIALHYKNSVLPLRVKIEEESLLTYNGMITNTFELLADTRAKIGTLLQSVKAKREFWLADASLNAAIYGGGTSASTNDGEGTSLTTEVGAGH